jgi:hypothetical protein
MNDGALRFIFTKGWQCVIIGQIFDIWGTGPGAMLDAGCGLLDAGKAD